jgi:hypothetical protein
MADANEKKRGFVHLSRAWYGEANLRQVTFIDQINIGLYSDSGQIGGEIVITWCVIGTAVCPRLECFDDAWENLAFFSELIKTMAEVDNKCVTPDKFRELLLSCGFEDMTPTSAENHEVKS